MATTVRGNSNSSSGALSSSGGSKKEAGFGGWLQRVRRTGDFSDVVVRINEAAEFRLHMLPLRNASTFFRGELRDDPSLVEIRDLPGGGEAFSIVADFCYLVKPSLTFDSVAGVRAAADKLGMPDLLDATKRFLYASVFSHWRSSIAFLERYTRLGGGSSVDEYIETRCLKVIATACTKAFAETKHVSVPIGGTASSTTGRAVVGAASAKGICWQSSPGHALAEVLVTVSSRLPDEYISQLVDILVEADVNLSVKCRQGRNVRAWLNHLLDDECKSDRSRCWVLICLSRMLLKSGGQGMELSSQYLCTLLEHVGHHVVQLKGQERPATGDKVESWDQGEMLSRLQQVKGLLEQRIGASLHELDDYLHSYRFPPDTLVSLVLHFVSEKDRDEQQLEEVAAEIDGCLWAFAESEGSITAEEFVAIFSAFPASSRSCHDTVYASIEKMLTKSTNTKTSTNNSFTPDQVQSLWALVDCDKLSSGVHEQALNNPSFLCQPHVLERVLRIHNEELAAMTDGQLQQQQRQEQGGGESNRKELRTIMQKVIKASLKLLEENSRRSKEIVELQRQYAALLGTGGGGVGSGAANVGVPVSYRGDSSSCDNSPDIMPFRRPQPQSHQAQQEQGKKANYRGFHRAVARARGTKSSSSDDEVTTMGSVLVAPQTPMVEARRSLHVEMPLV